MGKLLGGAQDAIGVVGGVARHLLWYLSYQIDGTAHEDENGLGPSRS